MSKNKMDFLIETKDENKWERLDSHLKSFDDFSFGRVLNWPPTKNEKWQPFETPEEVLAPEKRKEETVVIYRQGVLKETYYAQILDWDEESIKTEFCIDEENKVYETRHLPIWLIDDKLLNQGQLLIVLTYGENRSLTIKIRNGNLIVPKETFRRDDELKQLSEKLFKLD